MSHVSLRANVTFVLRGRAELIRPSCFTKLTKVRATMRELGTMPYRTLLERRPSAL